ncbi:MAG: MBL fold metallo-hydrolase [Bradymonadaceae bacterium]
MKKTLLDLAAITVGFFLVGACSTFSAPPYEGPSRDDFDGKRFKNNDEVEQKGFGDFLKFLFTREAEPWLKSDDREYTYGPPPPERVKAGDLRVTFVNHATMLVQLDELNVLTDPVWSERVGPTPYLGVKRVRPPGIDYADLPPIDVVIISHNHYDHFDIPTLRRLANDHQPLILVGLGSKGILEHHGVPGGEELGWGDERIITSELSIHRTPARHFAGRGLTDRDTNQWGSYVISSPHGSVYFAGDTGWGDHFQKTGEEFAPLRLAILPLGAYLPRWFMAPVHISPEEALGAHDVLGAQTSVGMHFGTFKLADDGEFNPPVRLKRALLARDALPHFWVLGFGEGRDVPALEVP